MNKIWDKIGLCASTLCLIHCLATPILLLLFPALKVGILNEEAFHEFFAVIVIISISIAVYPTCKNHGHKDIIAFAFAGVLSILASLFLPGLSTTAEHGLTILASVFLIIAHIKNIKVRHGKCQSSGDTDGPCSH